MTVFATLSSLIHRHLWRVVTAAILFVLVAVVFSGNVAGSLDSGGFNDPRAQSSAALNRLEQAARINRSQDIVALIRTGQPVQSNATRSEVERVAAVLRGDPEIARVLTVYQTHDPAMMSANGKETYVVADVRNISDNEVQPVTERLSRALKSDPYVTLGGGAFANVQVGDTVSRDLARSELLAFPLLFLLLLLFIFRGVVAAFFPIVMGMVTVLEGAA
jgi:RND superfamily putative drug exporter